MSEEDRKKQVQWYQCSNKVLVIVLIIIMAFIVMFCWVSYCANSESENTTPWVEPPTPTPTPTQIPTQQVPTNPTWFEPSTSYWGGAVSGDRIFIP